MQKSRHIAFYLLSLITITLLVTWVMSYATAHQFYRSRWQETETDYAEKAHWIFSNYGSVGIAWRLQQFPKAGNDFPGSSQSHQIMPASESTFSNVHALGLLPWHWFDYHNESIMHGITPVTNGQLFVPYWSLLLISILLTAAVYPRSNN